MATMLDGSISSEWWLEDHVGRSWHLYGGDMEGDRGVTLQDIDGESVDPDLTLSATATQIGERISGTAIPALKPTLVVNVHERSHPGAWEEWQTALPTTRDGWLVYAAGSGNHRYLRARRAGAPGKSVGDPYQVGLIQQSIPLIAMDGCWLGEKIIILADTPAQQMITGDNPAMITAVYQSAGTIRLTVDGDTWTTPLPNPGAGRTATTDLEPNQMMKTTVAGAADTPLWSTFRNRWNPLYLAPGAVVEAEITGVGNLIEIRQRYDGPWG